MKSEDIDQPQVRTDRRSRFHAHYIRPSYDQRGSSVITMLNRRINDLVATKQSPLNLGGCHERADFRDRQRYCARIR